MHKYQDSAPSATATENGRHHHNGHQNHHPSYSEPRLSPTDPLFASIIEARIEKRLEKYYDERVTSLKETYEAAKERLRDEIDRHKSLVNEADRKLNEERTRAFQENQQIVLEKNAIIEELRNTNREMQTKIAIQETEGKYRDKPFSAQIIELLEKMGPNFASIFAALQQQGSSAQVPQLQQPQPQPDSDPRNAAGISTNGNNAAGGPEQSSGYSNENTTQEDRGAQGVGSSSRHHGRESTTTPTKEEQMTAVFNQFEEQAFDQTKAAFTSPEAAENANAWLEQSIVSFKSHGVPIPANTWINLAMRLCDHAQAQEIAPAKVADVIYPVVKALANKSTYQIAINAMPPGALTEMLLSATDLKADEAQKALVTEVLAEIKKKVKQSS